MKIGAIAIDPPARRLILGALVAKLVLIAAVRTRTPSPFFLFDSGSYVRSAQALLSAHRFSISLAHLAEPQIVRTPGYPALIAAVYAVGGEHPWLMAVVSSLLVAGTAVIVSSLARKMAGASAGTAAALLYCVEPSTFHYGTLVMSEAPFTFCLALALFFLYRAVVDRSAWPATGFGALLGIATLVRPILAYAIFPMVLCLGAALLQARQSPGRAALKASVCAGAAFAILVPWQLRNWRATGDGSLSQIKSVNLYFFDAATVVAGLRHQSVRVIQEEFGLHEFACRFGFVATDAEASPVRPRVELDPARADLPLISLAHSYRDRGLAIVRQRPLRAVLDRLGSLWQLLWVPNAITWSYQYGLFDASGEFTRLWVYPRPFQACLRLARSHAWLALLTVALMLPVAVIYSFAWIGAFRSTGTFRNLMIILLCYLLVASTVPGYPDDRLRVPLFPILCVFAGIGLARSRRSPA